MDTFLITGSAGFIGFHIAKRMLDEGCKVIGIDNFSDYYDVKLKKDRASILKTYSHYIEVQGSIEEPDLLKNVCSKHHPDYFIHLAAQAGVRYSLENPGAYIQSNIVGTFELLEAAKIYRPQHILLASTSSAYGANIAMPYLEKQKTDHQVSIYAATKKSSEILSHAYSHLCDLPITAFRFFTVYGPYGRPDMAPHKFTSAILSGKPIDVFNNGKMERDFTFIDDLVEAVYKLVPCKPDCAKQKYY